ncbi:MAG: RNA polymerase sigma factor [Kiritimatiellales bacterium]
MKKEEWITLLVERYEKPLCSYAFSLLHDLDRARDAVQDTFLRLCRQKPSKLEGHEAQWLFRVCRNRTLDILRKETPMNPMSSPQEAALPSGSPAPDQQAARQDFKDLLPRLLSSLPEKQQEVIRLKFQQHLSYREIAHCTRLSESNVGWLLHTGIKTLREQMANL